MTSVEGTPDETTAAPSISTIGALRESGWTSRPVKEEVRRNAVAKIKAQQEQLTAQAATIEQQKATIDALREELAAAQAAAASSPSEDSSEASENFVKVKRTAPPEVPECEAAPSA